ncbi:MAG: IS1182 family transposase [Aureliella sp.]
MSKNKVNRAAVRVSVPQRHQIQWQAHALDELIASDHRVRLVWQYVDSMDLSVLYARIRAVPGEVGRNAIDPRILLALWLFATIEGVSSARQLARLCERDLAYKWICGEVGVNYHTLSDFRSQNAEFLEQLLTDSVAALMHQGLVTLEVVAQDGVRVRASAGKSSFRRAPTLQECHKQAREHVQHLAEESRDESAHGQSDARREAAQKRAAQEREARVKKALEEAETLKQEREKRKKGTGETARASTTDPQARVMKMAGGDYRPGYNVQFATDGASQVIVGVDVTNSGNDGQQMVPMHEKIVTSYHKTPEAHLVDGGFPTKEAVTALEKKGTKVYAPIHDKDRMEKRGVDPYARQPRDTDESFAFRQRMATPEAQTLYKRRASIAEHPNAECRNRGLQQFRVRGLAKVKAVALWYALSYNLMRMISLNCLA